MDRHICYSGAIPLDTDLLHTNKDAMVGLAYAMQAVLGTSTVVDGLACTPNSPAAMNVLVAPGSIYSVQETDASAYGSLAIDAINIVKQGIIGATTTLSCPAPVTTGQSVVYLVEAAYQDVDAGSTVLPYYNASNPSVAWSGPSNSGVSQNTVRKGVCTIQIKTGTPATTGTQTTPSADAGYTGLYAITVANGASSVTSGNIQTLSTAPFFTTKLPQVPTAIQQGTQQFAHDTSGSANTITVALSPTASNPLQDGQPIRVKVANSSTGATVMNVGNGQGNISCVTTSGSAFAANTVVANGIYTFVYDANGTKLQLQGFTAASATGLLPANNLSDVSSPSTSRTNLGVTATGSDTTYCYRANNLSDVANATTARGNISAAKSGANTDITSLSAPALGAATATTQAASDNTTKVSTTAQTQAAIAAFAQPITNSLGADVTMTSSNTYYTGPTVAQGSTGTWFASGQVTVTGTNGDAIVAKLWDGTTVIASAYIGNSGVHNSIALSGFIASPAGNLRISVSNNTSGGHKIVYNDSGTGLDSTISAFRIA